MFMYTIGSPTYYYRTKQPEKGHSGLDNLRKEVEKMYRYLKIVKGIDR